MNYVLSESAAKALARLLKDSRAVKPVETDGPRKERISPVSFDVFPFKVIGVEGGWRIYLPPGCVSYQTSDLFPGGVTAYGSEGWYDVDDPGSDMGDSPSTAKKLCLVITDSGTLRSASIMGETDAASAADAIVIAPLAEVFYVDDGDNNARVSKQIARSSFAFDGVGGGGVPPSGTGFNGDIITGVEFTTGSNAAINFYKKHFTFVNGILPAVDANESIALTIDTTPHSSI